MESKNVLTVEKLRAAVKKLKETAIEPEPCGCTILREANAILTCDAHSKDQ